MRKHVKAIINHTVNRIEGKMVVNERKTEKKDLSGEINRGQKKKFIKAL